MNIEADGLIFIVNAIRADPGFFFVFIMLNICHITQPVLRRIICQSHLQIRVAGIGQFLVGDCCAILLCQVNVICLEDIICIIAAGIFNSDMVSVRRKLSPVSCGLDADCQPFDA